jgi:hypothetical protein
MAEDEKTKKKNDLKIKKRDYTGYDDDEFAPGNQGMKRAVLSKYDEELNGPLESVCILCVSLSYTDMPIGFSTWCFNSFHVKEGEGGTETARGRSIRKQISPFY